MNSKIKTLTNTPLFGGLADDQLEEISKIAVEKNFNRGELIFSEGEDAHGFYIIASGSVKIFKSSPDGKEQILHILGPGEPFAEVPVFTGGNFPASSMTLKKSTLLLFPRQDFHNMINKRPSLAMGMLSVLSMRLKEFAAQIEYLSLKEVPSRIASYLLLLSEEQGNSDMVTLAISKGQIASLLGTIPETFSRILAKMSGQDLIDVKGKKIHLLDIDGLIDLSESGK